MSTVSRRARIMDLVALGCIVVGVALYMMAAMRLQEIGKLSFQNPGPRELSALAAADRARYLSYGGIAAIVAGCLLGVAGLVAQSRNTRIN